MEETLVSLEIAILLKEHGFNWPCNYFHYTSGDNNSWDGRPCPQDWNQTKDMCSKPSLSVAQTWLRNEKEIIVIADYDVRGRGKWNYEYWDKEGEIQEISREFDSYEKALEEGLLTALKFMK